MNTTPLPLFERTAQVLGWVASAFFAILVLNVLWGVFSRYVIGTQSRWTEEVAIYLFVWVSLVGGALAYREHAHLGFDYITARLHSDARKVVDFIGTVVVAVFVVIIFIGGGTALAHRAFTTGQTSPAVGFPIWVFYAGIPMSGAFFLLFSLEHLIRPARPDFNDPAPTAVPPPTNGKAAS